MRNCMNCAHWQGTKYSEWADCYHVAFVLDDTMHKIKNRFGFNLTPPFDPHDYKYIDNKDTTRMPITDGGYRLELSYEEDVTYDNMGNERQKHVLLPFYKSYKDSTCKLHTFSEGASGK